ncbi:MAG: NAD(+)/NADH kinase [Treponema sp.]|nr:NAD(+)/NADH kinase [Treponema sp.]
MKRCLIVVNTKKEKSNSLADELVRFLDEKGIEAKKFAFDGFCDINPFYGFDFVITLGGDGTVLFASRGCAHFSIPVFPVNLGEFGFIASIQVEDCFVSLESFLQGKSTITERSLIEAELYRGGKIVSRMAALNDIVICAKEAANTIDLNTSFNSLPLCHLKADGVILSTPTGSTAYSTSAGGPIVDPELDAILLTPINPFSLSSRPIVLNGNGEVEIEINECRVSEIVMKSDGQKPVKLEFSDIIKIKKMKEKAVLVDCTQERFYSALRSKLNWSGGPYA